MDVVKTLFRNINSVCTVTSFENLMQGRPSIFSNFENKIKELVWPKMRSLATRSSYEPVKWLGKINYSLSDIIIKKQRSAFNFVDLFTNFSSFLKMFSGLFESFFTIILDKNNTKLLKIILFTTFRSETLTIFKFVFTNLKSVSTLRELI